MPNKDTLQLLPFLGDMTNFRRWSPYVDDLLDISIINLDFIDLTATGALIPYDLIFEPTVPPPSMTYSPSKLLCHTGTMLTYDNPMARERFIAAIMHDVCRPSAEQVAKEQIEILIRRQVRDLSGSYDLLMSQASKIRKDLDTKDNTQRHIHEINIRRENTSDILLGSKSAISTRLHLIHIIAYTHARDMLKARVSGHGYWEDDVTPLPNRPLLHIISKDRGTSAVDMAYTWYVTAYKGLAYSIAQL